MTDTEISNGPERARPPKPSRRGYVLLIIAVATVIAGWSGVWVYGRSVLAGQLELQFQRMAGRGLELSCAELSIAGYPFRYEVACRDLRSADRRGTAGSLGGLDAVALIYNPRHVIFELSAPASLAVPLSGVSGGMIWQSARASMKFGSKAPVSLDTVLDRPEATFEAGMLAGRVSADKVTAHVRGLPGQPETLEGFATVEGPLVSLLPDLSQAVTLRAHARIEDGMGLLAGTDPVSLVQAAGGSLPIELVLVEAVIGEGRAAARGNLVLAGDGTLSGSLDLTLGNAASLLRSLKPLFPPQDRTYPMLEGVVNSLEPAATEIDGVRSITIPVTLTSGLVQLGFLPVGRIPPLFQAGS